MQKPMPLKYSACEGCDEESLLLMPVGFAPGFPVIVWLRLCLQCRLNEISNEWCLMADDIKHHQRPETRAAYPEWLAATV